MEVATAVIDVAEEEEEPVDYEEYEEEDDDGPLEESDLVYQSNTPFSRVTYNPNQPTRPLTEIERKIQLGGMALEYGIPKNKDVKLRFIVGVRERKRAPGKAPEIDRYRRSWNKLKDFMRDHNWRRILSNHFEGDYQDEAMPFEIDGYRWKTVTHFMLGMLYASVPSFAILFSLNSMENENGYWGTVKSAVRAHLSNINGGPHQPDPDYRNKVEEYLRQGLLAKFTQNPIAKQALLLTEDAVIAIRGGPDGILDVPTYDEVRREILENPTVIFKGRNAPTAFVKEEIPYLRSNEQLNHGYVDRNDANATEKIDVADLIGGSVTRDSVYSKTSIRPVMKEVAQIVGQIDSIETEAIVDCLQIVYLITGTYNFSLPVMIKNYGQPRFVRRHIYGLEKIADNLQEQLMIGIQRQPSSLISEYIVFDVELPGTLPTRISIYLEPFEEGFGFFLVTSERKQQVLDFFRAIRAAVTFQEPRGLGEFVEDAQTDIMIEMKRVTTIELGYEEIYWRLKAVNSFVRYYDSQIGINEPNEELQRNSKFQFLVLFDLVLGTLADFNSDDLFNQAKASADAESNLEAVLKDFRDRLKSSDVKLDPRMVTDSLLQLIADSKASALKAGIHAPLYNTDPTTGRKILIDRDFKFDIDDARFKRLSRHFPSDAIAGIQITRMLMAHDTITLNNRVGALMLTSGFYQCLHQIYPLSLDGFSSPLGSLIAPPDVPYGSLLDRVDKPFDSLGNIFRLDFSRFITGQVEVNAVLNVPSYKYLIGDLLEMIDRWFREASLKNVVLRLFVLIPQPTEHTIGWIDRQQYLRLKVELKGGEYVQQSTKTQELVKINYDSVFIVLDSSPVAFRSDLFNACLEQLKPQSSQ